MAAHQTTVSPMGAAAGAVVGPVVGRGPFAESLMGMGAFGVWVEPGRPVPLCVVGPTLLPPIY